jgi:hypothetical protein
MSKKVLLLPLGVEAICNFLHLLSVDVLCPFVTDGGKQRITHRLDTDAVQSGESLCRPDLNRHGFLPLSAISTGREQHQTTDGGKARK